MKLKAVNLSIIFDKFINPFCRYESNCVSVCLKIFDKYFLNLSFFGIIVELYRFGVVTVKQGIKKIKYDKLSIRPIAIYRIIYLSNLSRKISKNNMTFNIYRINFCTSVNLEKFYRLNGKSHLSVSTGVWC